MDPPAVGDGEYGDLCACKLSLPTLLGHYIMELLQIVKHASLFSHPRQLALLNFPWIKALV